MYRPLLLLTLLFTIATTHLSAQRVLLLEKYGQSKSQRLVEGDGLTFRMKGDNFWQSGVITELRPDIQAIVMNERFVMIDEIEALRLSGSGFANYAGLTLMTFGAGWSFFGLVGYPLDGNPETNYGTFDLTITATAVASGFLLRQLFARKKMKLNKRNRLRIVDLTF